MMAGCIYEDKLDYEDGKKDPEIEKSDKFSHIKWVDWEDMVYTYFTAMENIRGVRLTYIILNTPHPSGIVMDMEQEIIQNAPL